MLTDLSFPYWQVKQQIIRNYLIDLSTTHFARRFTKKNATSDIKKKLKLNVIDSGLANKEVGGARVWWRSRIFFKGQVLWS